ncbi:MAG: hypothetical protein H5U29_00570 [Pusillimonas sp.]|nr:hypothetical protein [Pusillimonas sp.]
MQGVLFHFSRLSLDTDLANFLNVLTLNDAPFERILFSQGQVLLSGWDGEHHWLLHLGQMGPKVEGVISVLPFEQQIVVGKKTQEASLMEDWAGAYARFRHKYSKGLP